MGHANLPTPEMGRQRLIQFLDELARQGITQRQVAARANVPAQVLTDIKHGRRPITELVARRLGDAFGINYQWFLGTSISREPPALSSMSASSGLTPSVAWAPRFPSPIFGDPRRHPKWDGSEIEVAGLAAAQLAMAQWPYVLHFDQTDVEGRLRRGDLVLISQSSDPEAAICVVKDGHSWVLARRAAGRAGWTRLAKGKRLPEEVPTAGHCLGVVWS
jgi:transcriptional regulator with XRE-family HTH domain